MGAAQRWLGWVGIWHVRRVPIYIHTLLCLGQSQSEEAAVRHEADQTGCMQDALLYQDTGSIHARSLSLLWWADIHE